MSSKKPIKLYWWNSAPNFGDALSPEVVEYVSGRGVQWSPMRECDLFALGSIMRSVRKTHNTPRDGDKPYVWGTGSMSPHRMDFLTNVRITAVRGPLTAGLLGEERLPKGDPGLLVAEMYGGRLSKQKKYKLGIVLHHHRKPSSEMEQYVSHVKHTCVIDVRNADGKAVVERIANCEFIVSTSLHGLIVADALGIPNVWLNPAGNHPMPRFKFYDYANSIGRPVCDPSSFAEFVDSGAVRNGVDCAYFKNIPAVADQLRNAFPQELRSNG